MQVEVRVEHDLLVIWSVALHMCCHQTVLDITETARRLSAHFPGITAFSTLTLLVGQQEGHEACKNRVVDCWCGYLSGARCRLAYGPADATATHYLLLE